MNKQEKSTLYKIAAAVAVVTGYYWWKGRKTAPEVAESTAEVLSYDAAEVGGLQIQPRPLPARPGANGAERGRHVGAEGGGSPVARER